MRTLRQEKIDQLLKRDLSSCIDELFRTKVKSSAMVSVSGTRTTSDLSIAKVYLSVLPSEAGSEVLNFINENKSLLKKKLAQLNKNTLRRMPDFLFYLDRSLDEVEEVERALKGLDNPIL